jgi:AP-4 complex subunit beta-1
MIYLYLVNYAESNSDVALMAVNTFNMDCEPRPGSDPKIRGLALRNLCSLRFTGAFEYIIPAIEKALRD